MIEVWLAWGNVLAYAFAMRAAYTSLHKLEGKDFKMSISQLKFLRAMLWQNDPQRPEGVTLWDYVCVAIYLMFLLALFGIAMNLWLIADIYENGPCTKTTISWCFLNFGWAFVTYVASAAAYFKAKDWDI